MNNVKNLELEGISSSKPKKILVVCLFTICPSSGEPWFFLRKSCVKIWGWGRKHTKPQLEYGFLAILHPTLLGRRSTPFWCHLTFTLLKKIFIPSVLSLRPQCCSFTSNNLSWSYWLCSKKSHVWKDESRLLLIQDRQQKECNRLK